MNIMFMCNREIRIIPRGWQHPKAPLLPEQMPNVDGLAPEATEIAAYETTSEGTPISPAFPNSSEGRFSLVQFCTENCSTFADMKTGAEAWATILFGDGCTLVSLEGRVEISSRIR